MNKRISIILIIVVVILVAIYAGFLWRLKKSGQSGQIEQPSTAQTPKQTSPDTTGYFEDKTLGISLVNPSDFHVDTLHYRKISEVVFVKPPDPPKNSDDYPRAPHPITIEVSPDTTNGNVTKVAGNDNEPTQKLIQKQTELISGQKAYIIKGDITDGAHIDQRVVFANGNVYQFILMEPESEKLFLSVLQSVQLFKPVPAIPDTETQVYQNKRYGFSFEYPKSWTIDPITIEEAAQGALVSIISPANKKLIDFFDKYPLYVEGPPLINFYIIRYKDLNNDYARGGSWEGMKDSYTSWDQLLSDKNQSNQKVGETTVGGVKAAKVIQGGLGQSYALYLEHNGFYQLDFLGAEDEASLLPEEKAILNSFKFTK